MTGRYASPPRTVKEVLAHLEAKNGWNDAVAQLLAIAEDAPARTSTRGNP